MEVEVEAAGKESREGLGRLAARGGTKVGGSVVPQGWSDPFVQLVSHVGLTFSEDAEGDAPGKERSRGVNLGSPTTGEGGSAAAFLATTLLVPPFGESSSPSPSPTEPSIPSISCFQRWSSPLSRSSSSAPFATLALRSRWNRGPAAELRLTLLRRLWPLAVVLSDVCDGDSA